ncbi:copper resistance protein CopC [Paenibacillus lupini]|uniref:copper resistance CopC family protein n=1 Tax=Paenibacillus lupini TaxID=1450204 RepID=UPI00141D9411|nr:copper resistance CopC family protein [Paenibacillus lupini]NIK24775.1 hypothetical protein [Paenibacillus lupini]
MKRILLICLAALFLLPSVAMAHSRISESMPAKDATVTASPTEISMTFNTNIENLSKFKLINETGEQVPTGDITVNEATMSSSVAEPLKNGAYTVKWTIIGADGHAVDGEYAFTVNAPEATTPEATPAVTESPSPAADETTAPDENASASPTVSEDPPPSAAAEDDTASKNSDSNPAIWIIAGVVVVAAVFFMIRRRRK